MKNDLLNPTGRGAWEFLESQTVTNVTEIEFLGLEQGVLYKINYYIEPSGTTPKITFNDDAGNRYTKCGHEHGDIVGAHHVETHSTGGTRFAPWGNVLSDYFGEITFCSAGPASNTVFIIGQGFGYKDSDEYVGNEWGGRYQGIAALTSIQIFASAGDFDYAWATLRRLVEDLP